MFKKLNKTVSWLAIFMMVFNSLGSYSVKASDTVGAEFTFMIVDSATGSGLKDAVFILKDNDSGKEIAATSDSDGNISFSGVYKGSYTLMQTKAPSGYAVCIQTYEVDVNGSYKVKLDGDWYENTLKIKNAKALTFINTNEDGKAISGAVFALYNSSGTEKYTAIADAKGTVTFTELLEGTYTLKQKTAAQGYNLLTQTHTIKVDSDKNITVDGNLAAADFSSYKFESTRIPNTLSFYKTNSSGNDYLSGAEFGLYQGDAAVYTAISGKDGAVVFNNIEPGSYTLKETQAPQGYDVSEETHEVTVAKDMSITVDDTASSQSFSDYKFTNDQTPVSTVAPKMMVAMVATSNFTENTVSNSGLLGIAGSFNLFVLEDCTFLADSEGRMAVGGNMTASGFGIDTLSTTSSSKGSLFAFGNTTLTSGQVFGNMVLNSDKTNNIASSASATGETVYRTSSNFPINFTQAATDLKNLTAAIAAYKTTGTAVKNQYYNSWTLTDTTNDVAVFNVNGASQIAEIDLQVKSGATVIINVTGVASKAYTMSGGQMFLNNTTNTKVLWNFPDATSISVSAYTVEGAVLAPYATFYGQNGSVNGNLVIKKYVNQGGFETHFHLFTGNPPSCNSNGFSFYKTDDSGSTYLSGAVFGLYNGDTLAYSATSDSNGKVRFTDMAAGTYTLKEVTAPSGYYLSQETHTVVVNSDLSVTIDGSNPCTFSSYKFKDTNKTGTFYFYKVNDDGNYLSGAVFQLTKGNTTYYTATSDSNGKVTFTGLKAGTYIMTEVTPPDGYQRATESHTVIVESSTLAVTVDGQSADSFTTYKLVNTTTSNSFSFFKTNTSETRTLAGAVFILKNNNDEEKYRAVSDANGVVTFTNIAPGNYLAIEIEAPEGYQVSGERINVKVADDLSIRIYSIYSPSQFESYKYKDAQIPNGFTFLKTDDSDNLLAGAEFGLYVGSTVVYSATSNASGVVSFENIEPGTYTLKEKAAVNGYEISTETHQVVVASDMSTKVDGNAATSFSTHKYVNKKIPNGFTFIKKNNAGTVQEGAIFGLYQNDTLIYSATSNASGVVTFTNINSGTYTLKEKQAPTGYQLSTETHTVVVASDASIKIDGNASSSFATHEYINQRTPNGFTFKKVNGNDAALSGAVFGLYQNDTAVYSATSDASGVVSFANIEPGTYTLKETSAPTGYEKSTETHTVVVAADMSITIDTNASSSFATHKYINNRTPNSFSFKKTNGSAALPGAQFGLYQGSTEVYSAISNSSGVVIFANIEPGTYTLKETSAPTGYEKSTETHTVVVAANMSITIDGNASSGFSTHEYVNNKTPNGFTLIKVDGNNAVLSGAVFGLYQGTTVKYSATSNVSGVVSFTNIEPGTYTLKETSAPTGYDKSTETHTVVVAADRSITIDSSASSSFASHKIKNTRTPNGFTFQKTNEDGSVGLSGAVFGLYQGTTEVYSATSASDGTVTFSNIEPGTYTLKETTPPAGYLLTTETHTVTVEEDMTLTVDWTTTTSEMTVLCCPVVNKIKDQPNGFSFKKTNADGTKGLSGAVFGLYQGSTLLYNATSASDGTVIFSTIAPGTYTLKEKTAPTGYQLSTETHTVVVANDGSIKIDGNASSSFSTHKYVNNRTPNGFTFSKVDGNNAALSGAVFGLYQGDTAVYSATSNSSGAVSFANIEPGTYTLKETSAPTGYDKSTETHTVVVAVDMSITIDNAAASTFATHKYVNDRTPNGFSFLKVDGKNAALAGAVFGLYQADTSVYSTTSASDGTVTFSNIEPGTYTLKETSAPTGYKSISETHTVVVASDMSITIDGNASASFSTHKYINERIPNGFNFVKTTMSGNGLSGAVFGLYQDDTIVYSATSDASGLVSFSNIEPGTYVLKETTAPTGYQKINEEHNVVVASDMSIKIDDEESEYFECHQYKNERIPNSFSFKKVDGKDAALSGAVFGLYDGSALIYSATSNASGIVTFNNIEPGTYTLKEKSAPTGYDKSTETHEVVVAADMSITIDNAAASTFATHKYVNNRTPNGFTFNKVDGKNAALAGAEFRLYQGTTSVYTAISSSAGVVTFANIEPGTYTLKETSAPTGYEKSTETHTVVVAADMSITIDGNASASFSTHKYINERIPNGFNFVKTTMSGNGLSGAVFGLYQGDTVVYSATSNASGVVSFANIEPGTYTLKETSAPTGYDKSTETHTVVVAADMSITIDNAAASTFATHKYVNDRTPNGFTFSKVDGNNAALSGAVFGLYQADIAVYSATSNASGVVSFANIEPGTYALKETTAPVGYDKSTETHEVVVAADMSITIDNAAASTFATHKYVNNRTPNGFTFNKVDGKNAALAGAEFRLYQGTTSVYTAISSSAGVVTFANIEPGTYTLKETSAPTGYDKSTETHTVVVAADMSITIDSAAASTFATHKYVNDRTPNGFTFNKVDGMNAALEGAVFGLYQADTAVYSATSNASGVVSFTNIEPGTYTLKETSAPVGYDKSTDTYTVVVAADMSITIDNAAASTFATHKYVNNRTPNEFTFNKVDGKNAVLPGAVFGLYQADIAVYSATSNASGVVSFANIEPGTYTLKETSAPTGYDKSTETHEVVVAADMSIIIDSSAASTFATHKYVNDRTPNGFTFNKVDGKNAVLPEALFGLYQADTAVYSATSNSSGIVSFANIEPGTYTLKETSAPTGYDKSTETHTVVVAADMSITIDNAAASTFATHKYINNRTPNGFTFNKVDGKNAALSGAVFGLYQADIAVYSATSNASGVVSFANIEPGTYTLKETSAPTGYDKSTETHEVVVAADMSIIIDSSAASAFATHKYINNRTPNGFTFNKVDGKNTVLAGAVFGLYQADTAVYSATSNASGVVSFANIEPGTYTLKETSAPTGYDKSTETHTVVVAADMSITIDDNASSSFVTHKYINNRTPNSFSFNKVDSKGNALSGAEFGLYIGNTLITSTVSAAAGKVQFANIEPGTYILKEIKAPQGYVKSSEQHIVDVAEDMNIEVDGNPASYFETYKLKNTENEIPKTGEDYQGLLFAGFSLMTLGGLLLIMQRKKRKYN